MTFRKTLIAGAALTVLLLAPANAHEIKAETGNAAQPAFDVVHAKIEAKDNWLEFHMHVAAAAGSSTPTATGKFAGSNVFSYVWPTKINSAEVGFEADQGILAMALTSHPDFDDTPLFDENGDGDLGNDGAVWHSHWVVLVPDEACGPGSLKVKDIPEGTSPRMPRTWPDVPILLDSPGYTPVVNGRTVEVRAPFPDTSKFKDVAFDAVTAGLRVNQSVHNPLLCVVDVWDVASGNLSLPGRIN